MAVHTALRYFAKARVTHQTSPEMNLMLMRENNKLFSLAHIAHHQCSCTYVTLVTNLVPMKMPAK